MKKSRTFFKRESLLLISYSQENRVNPFLGSYLGFEAHMPPGDIG
jgi:hypothetical protein